MISKEKHSNEMGWSVSIPLPSEICQYIDKQINKYDIFDDA